MEHEEACGVCTDPYEAHGFRRLMGLPRSQNKNRAFTKPAGL